MLVMGADKLQLALVIVPVQFLCQKLLKDDLAPLEIRRIDVREIVRDDLMTQVCGGKASFRIIERRRPHNLVEHKNPPIQQRQKKTHAKSAPRGLPAEPGR